MDLNMPVKDGYDATKEILTHYKKQEQKEESLPVIAVTAYSNKENIKLCKKAGMKTILHKPVNP